MTNILPQRNERRRSGSRVHQDTRRRDQFGRSAHRIVVVQVPGAHLRRRDHVRPRGRRHLAARAVQEQRAAGPRLHQDEQHADGAGRGARGVGGVELQGPPARRRRRPSSPARRATACSTSSSRRRTRAPTRSRSTPLRARPTTAASSCKPRPPSRPRTAVSRPWLHTRRAAAPISCTSRRRHGDGPGRGPYRFQGVGLSEEGLRGRNRVRARGERGMEFD